MEQLDLISFNHQRRRTGAHPFRVSTYQLRIFQRDDEDEEEEEEKREERKEEMRDASRCPEKGRKRKELQE